MNRLLWFQIIYFYIKHFKSYYALFFGTGEAQWSVWKNATFRQSVQTLGSEVFPTLDSRDATA